MSKFGWSLPPGVTHAMLAEDAWVRVRMDEWPTRIEFTEDERKHLEGLILNRFYASPNHDEQMSPAYWRWLAESEAEAIARHDRKYGYVLPEDEDFDSPTPGEMLEMAEALECGFVPGEVI